MKKMPYDSPELDIRWFESEEICSHSDLITDEDGEDTVLPDDEW